MVWIPLEHFSAGLISFVLCWCAHALLWRNFPPRRTLGSLMVIFLFVPSVFFFSFSFFSVSISELLAPWLLSILLGVNYIAAYPAIENKSPSLHILLVLKSSPGGLRAHEIQEFITKDLSLSEKWGALKQSKLIKESGRQRTLTWRGKLLAYFFIFFRRSLGLPLGAG